MNKKINCGGAYQNFLDKKKRDLLAGLEGYTEENCSLTKLAVRYILKGDSTVYSDILV